ncbi:MAG: hypothetical protein GOVbin1096_133 [Prokaryotic dsDNA virus sp.]|jgi:hypothetical protein|nr:MAG: hypothetical protein GOVbin1096_133 [Prokaryotic dsDNA virus sp.]|tara:strand:- start:34954 stop:35319 length:366 start_codon:yes stop_codon:yes gene_type:complete
MLKGLRNYVSDFFEAIFYEGPVGMTPEQENYQHLIEEREQMIHTTVKGILYEVEKVCRQENSVEITGYGFNQVSPILYEDSWYEIVVNRLQDLGYRCRMNFDYSNGKLQSSLTVSWWGLDK